MASDVAVAAAVTRPQIHVRGAVKSFSGRVVVDVDDLVLGRAAHRGSHRSQRGRQDHADAR